MFDISERLVATQKVSHVVSEDGLQSRSDVMQCSTVAAVAAAAIQRLTRCRLSIRFCCP